MKKELICIKRDGYWFHAIFHYKGSALSKEAIVIDDSDTNKFVEYINKMQLDKVIVDLNAFKSENLYFLNKIDHIKYLTIWGDGECDFSAIYNLDELVFLDLMNSSDFNLERMKNLTFFSTNSLSRIKNIEKTVTLKTLQLIDPLNSYEIKDLTRFSKLNSIDTLSLYGLKIKSLCGIKEMSKLKVLLLRDLKILHDISEINCLSSKLSGLLIDRCKKIVDYSVLSSLNKLHFLSLNNVKVPGLDFLSPLRNLNTFISSNSIFIDGDLSFVNGVQSVVIYPIRKSYYIICDGMKLKYKQKSIVKEFYDYGDGSIDSWRRINC
ncbi:hypothetical protein RJI07_08625 [Mycoplasmatota bacterium WC30]